MFSCFCSKPDTGESFKRSNKKVEMDGGQQIFDLGGERKERVSYGLATSTHQCVN